MLLYGAWTSVIAGRLNIEPQIWEKVQKNICSIGGPNEHLHHL